MSYLKLGLEAKSLAKIIKKRRVINDVTISVLPGEIVGLLGPNGAGKTTAFYIMVGLIQADEGTVFLDGIPIHNKPIYVRAKMGLSYLPQEPSIFRKLNVLENIQVILELQSDAEGRLFSRESAELQAKAILVDLGLMHLSTASALSLSGGERRRVEIGRTMATNPKYILFDEPFAGIDPIAMQGITRLIQILASRGIGVLITDHNVHQTLKICHRSYIVNQGDILIHGTSAEIIADEQVRKIYLGNEFDIEQNFKH